MKRLLLGSGVAAVMALPSCGSRVPDVDHLYRDNTGVQSIEVHVTNGMLGSLASPVPYSAQDQTYTVHITVHGADATAPLTSFNGFLSMSVQPGVLTGLQSANGTAVFGRSVQVAQGEADVSITFQRAFGETRVWAEDDGYVPADPMVHTPQCADGIDNNHNGRTDYPADYGCSAPNDDDENGGSFALGSSEPIVIASPRIYDVRGAAASSPLTGQRVDVTTGTMIVTGLNQSGLFVTDIDDRSCPDAAFPTDPTHNHACYNSVFAFNFSLPIGVRPCDELSELQGSVAEFASDTQLDQPSWQIAPDGTYYPIDLSGAPVVCRIPPAVEILPAAIASGPTMLNPYQSAIVRAHNLLLPTVVGPQQVCVLAGGSYVCTFGPGRSNCDVNGSGTIEYTNPTESNCASTCQRTVGCSEWTSWTKYYQLSVDFYSGQPAGVIRLAIAPHDALPNLDPTHPPPPLPMGFTITGNLLQAGPSYIVEPRCSSDVVLLPSDTEMPANQTCLAERTVGTGGM